MATKKKQEQEIEATEQIAAEQEPLAVAEITQDEQVTTKAGKRSAKSLREEAEKEAKEERKTHRIEAEAEAESKHKQATKPTRTRLERQGKKFRDAAAKIERGKLYAPAEALALAVATSPVKFDATVELHVNLNVDPKIADQNVRDNLVLPEGTGKTVRIAVFADDKIDGADVTGVATITTALEKGIIDFDILIATPANMPKLGKYARLLGPRGLMPNPKSGTVTTDVTRAVAEAKAGRVEYRVDSTGIVHIGIGKVSFGVDKLMQNFSAVIASIKSSKPASVKSGYIKAAHLATTMGPSIALALNEL